MYPLLSFPIDIYWLVALRRIFFPTDFTRLAQVATHITSTAAHNVGCNTFMMQWADVEQTRTASGYNPLLEDFRNTQFLLIGA